jgi:hypothetical protein
MHIKEMWSEHLGIAIPLLPLRENRLSLGMRRLLGGCMYNSKMTYYGISMAKVMIFSWLNLFVELVS